MTAEGHGCKLRYPVHVLRLSTCLYIFDLPCVGNDQAKANTQDLKNLLSNLQCFKDLIGWSNNKLAILLSWLFLIWLSRNPTETRILPPESNRASDLLRLHCYHRFPLEILFIFLSRNPFLSGGRGRHDRCLHIASKRATILSEMANETNLYSSGEYFRKTFDYDVWECTTWLAFDVFSTAGPCPTAPLGIDISAKIHHVEHRPRENSPRCTNYSWAPSVFTCFKEEHSRQKPWQDIFVIANSIDEFIVTSDPEIAILRIRSEKMIQVITNSYHNIIYSE